MDKRYEPVREEDAVGSIIYPHNEEIFFADIDSLLKTLREDMDIYGPVLRIKHMVYNKDLDHGYYRALCNAYGQDAYDNADVYFSRRERGLSLCPADPAILRDEIVPGMSFYPCPTLDDSQPKITVLSIFENEEGEEFCKTTHGTFSVDQIVHKFLAGEYESEEELHAAGQLKNTQTLSEKLDNASSRAMQRVPAAGSIVSEPTR